MNEALSFILCGETRWYFDLEQTYVKFNNDNTGVLCAGAGFTWWILSEFEWKMTSIEPPDQADHGEASGGCNASPPTTRNKSPHLLGQLDLEITLTKRLPSFARNAEMERYPIVNEGSLTDDAFRPKSFNVRIEQGNFSTPARVGSEFAHLDPSSDLRWAMRLVFDPSLYPPESEWKDTYGGRFWDFKEFVGRQSDELEKQGRAMNDSPTTGNTCIAS